MTDEDDIESIVQNELDALGSDVTSLSEAETVVEPPVVPIQETDSKSEHIPEYETLTSYQNELKLKRKAFQSQLDSCQQLLTSTNENINSCQQLRTNALEGGSGDGALDETALILKQIEDEDADAEMDVMFEDDTLDDYVSAFSNMSAISTHETNKAKYSDAEVTAAQDEINDADDESEEYLSIVPYDENKIKFLERQAKRSVLLLTQKQEDLVKKERQIQQDLIEMRIKNDDLKNEEKAQRSSNIKAEEERLKALQQKRERDLQKYLQDKESFMKSLNSQFEAQITNLEKKTQEEQRKLLLEINRIKEARKHAEQSAAATIQSYYRGYRVRKLYQASLQDNIQRRLEELQTKRLQAAEESIEKKLEEKRQEEERLRKIEEDKRAMEEAERRRKQAEERRNEQERLQKLEVEKRAREEEERRKEEELKKKEQERLQKLEVEKRAREEEGRRKEEELKKKEQERLQKLEEERKAKEAEKERLRQLKEEKRLEKERLKQEKEKLKKMEEEKKEREKKEKEQKMEEERIRKEQEERTAMEKKEMEQRIEQEQLEKAKQEQLMKDRKDADDENCMSETNSSDKPHKIISHNNANSNSKDMKVIMTNDLSEDGTKNSQPVDHNITDIVTSKVIEDVKTSKSMQRWGSDRDSSHLSTEKIEEYKQWRDECKATSNATTIKTMKGQPEAVTIPDMSLITAKIEERRKRWMQECKPWSQISAAAVNNILKPRRAINRPSSAAMKQEPIAEEMILNQSQQRSLHEVECVQLKDLPGCTLETLSSCKRVRAVSITHSGLMRVNSLEPCVKLSYLHLQGNAIDTVQLVSSTLTYLHLAGNNISAIRGFESCINLRYLNLSHNKITKMNNLGFFKKLNTLVMAHNELISTKGLSDCVTIQVLDLSHNHLTCVDELTDLGLLRQLKLTSNNIMEIPRLSNCVLLQELSLEDNSISTVEHLAYFWLPSLHFLNLSQNSISLLKPLHGCYFLRNVDLSNNQLVDVFNVSEGLSLCISIQQLNLKGNPISLKENYCTQIARTVPSLKKIDGEAVNCQTSQPSVVLDIVQLCNKADKALNQLNQRYHQAMHDNLSQLPCSNTALLKGIDNQTAYFDAVSQLAENIRYAHEFGSISFDEHESSTVHSSKASFESKLNALNKVNAGSIDGRVSQEEAVSSAAKDAFEQRLRAKLESTSLKVTDENIKLLKRSTSPRNLNLPKPEQMKEKSGLNGHHTTTASNLRKSSAKSGSRLSRKLAMNAAATKIQALWRGYHLRKQIFMALTHSDDNHMYGVVNEDDDEELAEVDLDSFNYNDDLDDWMPSAVPVIPQKHAVLPPHASFTKLPNETLADFIQQEEPKQAWRPSPSPSQEHRQHLSVMSGELTQRSKMSKKEELIAQDWGFKDSHTAELMMKRAKKLKYNAQRKKKMSQLDALSRYEVQKKMLETVEVPRVPIPVRKVAPKQEYFKALEQEARRKEHEKHIRKDAAVERTFEWVHTQVVDDSQHKLFSKIQNPIYREERVSSGESKLPYLDKRVLEGGSTQLVGSPLEIMSVDSYSYGAPSAASSRRLSQHSAEAHRIHHMNDYEALASTDDRFKPQGFRSKKKKTTHTIQEKNLGEFVSWGSGKKRTKK